MKFALLVSLIVLVLPNQSGAETFDFVVYGRESIQSAAQGSVNPIGECSNNFECLALARARAMCRIASGKLRNSGTFF